MIMGDDDDSGDSIYVDDDLFLRRSCSTMDFHLRLKFMLVVCV